MEILTKDTLEILKNFATINPALFFQAGRVLCTVDEAETIFARAEIDIKIPLDFAIHDLNEFLRGLSNFDTPGIIFEKERLVVLEAANGTDTKKRKKEIDDKNTYFYSYSDPSLVDALERDRIDMPTVDVSFDITENDFKTITKAARTLKLDLLEFEGTGKNLNLVARSSVRGSKQVFSRHIGKTNSVFRGILKLANFKIIPASYKIELSSEYMIHFISDKLEYWMSLEFESTFS